MEANGENNAEVKFVVKPRLPRYTAQMFLTITYISTRTISERPIITFRSRGVYRSRFRVRIQTTISRSAV